MTSIRRSMVRCASIARSLSGPVLVALIIGLPLACVLHCHFVPPHATVAPASAMFICHPVAGDPAAPPAPISFSTLRALTEWLPALLSILALPLAFPRRLLPVAAHLPAFLAYQPLLPPPRLH